MKYITTFLVLLSLSIPAMGAPVMGENPDCKINVNEATEEQLQFLYRVGPVLSSRIIEARPIADIEAYDSIKGIGEKTLNAHLPYITFEGETTCTEKLPSPPPESE